MTEGNLTDIHFEVPEQVACPSCSAVVDVHGQAAFATIQCPKCSTPFVLPVPFGSVVLMELLGEGGMGAVFKGYDPGLKRSVAVKVMRREMGAKAEFVSLFEHEAQMLAALNNPNVVQVYSTGNEQGQPYIAMELVDGGRLDVLMKKKKALEEAFVVRTAIDVVNGLRAAAAIGLAHGDLKPQNILFDRDGRAKVVDFGLARFKGEKWQPGVIWGTPYFIAPEVIRGKQPNLQADIYSLGCTLFNALAGKPPFDRDTLEQTVLARLKEKQPDLRDARADIHPETAAVISRMMEVETIRRYPNYESLLEDMIAAQKAIGRPSPAAAAAPPAWKAKSSKIWWMVSGGLSLVAIAVFLMSARRQQAPEQPPAPAAAAPAETHAAAPAPQTAAAPVPQLAVADKASIYADWKDGSTGGSGFGPWVLHGGAHAGFFLGSSTKNAGNGNIDTDGKSWGMYASAQDVAAAWRRLAAGPLAVGTQRFKIDFDHGNVDNGVPSVGVGLQNSATNNLWEFFLSGGSSTYEIHDGSGLFDTGMRRCDEAMRIEFRLKSPSNYSARVVCGTETNAFSGRLIADPDQAVRLVHLWNFSAGPGSDHDVYFNSMEIVPVRVK